MVWSILHTLWGAGLTSTSYILVTPNSKLFRVWDESDLSTWLYSFFPQDQVSQDQVLAA